MPIFKQITQQNRIVTYHEIAQTILSYLGSSAIPVIKLLSWEDSQAKLNDDPPLIWSTMAIGDCADYGNLYDVQQALVINDSELKDGVIVDAPVQLSPLETAQIRKWSEIKAKREQELVSPLATTFGVFGADNKGQTDITRAIMFAQELARLGETPEIDFTLLDNSVVTLTLPQLIEVGLTLAARVEGAHKRSRPLRTQIFSAETVEDVIAIKWESNNA